VFVEGACDLVDYVEFTEVEKLDAANLLVVEFVLLSEGIGYLDLKVLQLVHEFVYVQPIVMVTVDFTEYYLNLQLGQEELYVILKFVSGQRFFMVVVYEFKGTCFDEFDLVFFHTLFGQLSVDLFGYVFQVQLAAFLHIKEFK